MCALFSSIMSLLVLLGHAYPANAVPAESERSELRTVQARSYDAEALFLSPKPSRIGRRCVYPKFRWMVATNAPSGAEFRGDVIVTMGGKQYASLPYPRLKVNVWNSVAITAPVCEPGRYRIQLRGMVVPVAWGVATNEIYSRVVGGATYVIR
jgi:hypothetical protein